MNTIAIQSYDPSKNKFEVISDFRSNKTFMNRSILKGSTANRSSIEEYYPDTDSVEIHYGKLGSKIIMLYRSPEGSWEQY